MFRQLVIIVPGVGGSKIYCNCDQSLSSSSAINERKLPRLYPRRGWFFNSAIDDHIFLCTNIETKIMKTFWYISIYDKFIKKVNKSPYTIVKEFPYNWLLEPVEIAKNLFSFIMKCKPNTFQSIKLVGHSLGGLIIRIMLEYMNGATQLFNNLDQVTVYQCGTPMYGSRNLQDYNYGYELASVLTSSGLFYSSCPLKKTDTHAIRRIKPLMFSVSDLKKIIQVNYKSLLYLLPTPIIQAIKLLFENDELRTIDYGNFDLVYDVHMKLAKLDFQVNYQFYYNISCYKIEEVYIPFSENSLYSELAVHEIRPGKQKINCGIYLKRLLKSDGLVVPYSRLGFPNNCTIIVDESVKCKHAYLMNSKKIYSMMKDPQINLTYNNRRENFDDLPDYDTLYSI